MQRSLFATDEPRTVKTDGADVRYVAGWLSQGDADRLLVDMRALPDWRQDHIRIYGKTHPLPRLHRWFADSNQRYRWSGIEMHPEPFPPFLRPVLQRLYAESGFTFNTALGNLYRDGNDGVSWHSDDEPELGPNPTIASLSLGATRRFLLRSKTDHKLGYEFSLTHGSLLWMSEETQKLWEHCVPKSQRTEGERINITFRRMIY